MRHARGFTLLELLIALAIVGLLLTIARALGAAYPYRAAKSDTPEVVMLFNGAEQKLEFVTQAAPLPLQAPIAFTAVVISLESGEETGLILRERALPNRDPFTKGEIVMRDPAVTSLSFKFQNDDGDWVDTWDGQDMKAIPRGIQLTLGATLNGRTLTLPAITVTVRSTGVIR